MTDSTIVARVTEIVSAACGGLALAPDTPFLADGAIDSFGLIQLIETLEGSFGITIAPDALTHDNFQTVGAIAALIARDGSPSPG